MSHPASAATYSASVPRPPLLSLPPTYPPASSSPSLSFTYSFYIQCTVYTYTNTLLLYYSYSLILDSLLALGISTVPSVLTFVILVSQIRSNIFLFLLYIYLYAIQSLFSFSSSTYIHT